VEKQAQGCTAQDDRRSKAGEKAEKCRLNSEIIRRMTFFDGFNAALGLAAL
jgi:hypothetical protein